MKYSCGRAGLVHNIKTIQNLLPDIKVAGSDFTNSSLTILDSIGIEGFFFDMIKDNFDKKILLDKAAESYENRKSGKTVGQLFPNFSLFVYGGVNFEPYRANLFDAIGSEIDTLETFPASEGFFAYQNNFKKNDLILDVGSNDSTFLNFFLILLT